MYYQSRTWRENIVAVPVMVITDRQICLVSRSHVPAPKMQTFVNLVVQLTINNELFTADSPNKDRFVKVVEKTHGTQILL